MSLVGILGGLAGLGVVAAATNGSHYIRERRHRRLIARVLMHPDDRAAAIASLRREVEQLALSGTNVAGGGLRRSAALRDSRLALAELLLAEGRASEALSQISFIAVPLDDPPPAWLWRLRLLACQAELAARQLEAADGWLAALPPRAKPPSRHRDMLADLRAQIALARGAGEEALGILDRAPKGGGRITRARVLARLGREVAAEELLAGLGRSELARIQSQYSDEPISGLAAMLLNGPYR